jgi:hypothetical protein
MTINTDILKTLNPEQELFCIAYTTEGETFGHGTLAYEKAYNFDFASLSEIREQDLNHKDIIGTSERERAYNTCKVNASKLLTNTNIRERIRGLLLEQFNADEIIDAKLQSIILSGKDADAINAIKHRNDLKQRITKKVDVTTLGRPFGSLSDEELKKLIGE